MNLRALQRLLAAHVREDGGEPAGQHGLAGAGRSHHQDIVPAGGGNFQGSFHIFCPLTSAKSRLPGASGESGGASASPKGRLPDRWSSSARRSGTGRICSPSAKAALRGVLRGDKELPDPRARGMQSHGQRAAHRPHLAPQAELAKESGILREALYLARGGQNLQQNGQVVDRAGFSRVRRARLTVTRDTGKERPLFLMAARTLSRASFTAASGRPTTSNCGRRRTGRSPPRPRNRRCPECPESAPWRTFAAAPFAYCMGLPRNPWRESYISRMGRAAPYLETAARTRFAASAGDTVTCSPEPRSFRDTKPAAHSSSPTITAKGMSVCPRSRV